MKQFRLTVSLLALAASTSIESAGADEFGTGRNLSEIEFVPIGDPGNVGDAAGGLPLSGALEGLFGSPALPLSVPHPNCGIDPTPDTLRCNLAPFCP